MLATRRAKAELAAGNRQKAMGIVAATTLGRVWLMATAVLLVGLAEREAGLAAAILVLVLFTVSFAAQGLAHLSASPRGRERHERRQAPQRTPPKSGLSTKARSSSASASTWGSRS